ncbi:MAG: DUF928 domain-containing protein [Moorea sp. SIO2B7]|nr:DUF928 domain-containing protein [Moorena sp. SIO2B7]
MMTWKNCLRSLTLISVALSLELSLIPSSLAQVQANSQSEQAIHSTTIVQFDAPEGEGSSNRGGGTRGKDKVFLHPCPYDEDKLSLPFSFLIPANYTVETISDHPTFWLFVPETVAKQVWFELTDEEGNIHYTTEVDITNTPGILSLEIPTTEAALEKGKYSVSATVVCGSYADLFDNSVEIEIEHIEGNSILSSKLAQQPSLELAALYAKNGLWFETLTTLAQLRRSQPDNSTIIREWEQLLQEELTKKLYQEKLEKYKNQEDGALRAEQEAKVEAEAIATQPLIDAIAQ